MGFSGYSPIDEFLGTVRTRALRALRFFDWVSGEDLAEVMGLTDAEIANGSLPNAMKRSAKHGEIEMQYIASKSESGYEHTRGRLFYRITPQGKASLHEALARYEKLISVIQCPECRGHGDGCECCHEIGMVHESSWRAWKRGC